jgi:hypothetical protein
MHLNPAHHEIHRMAAAFQAIGYTTEHDAIKAMLLQMATMRRLTMFFMPKAANTKAEAINPIAPL